MSDTQRVKMDAVHVRDECKHVLRKVVATADYHVADPIREQLLDSVRIAQGIIDICDKRMGQGKMLSFFDNMSINKRLGTIHKILGDANDILSVYNNRR